MIALRRLAIAILTVAPFLALYAQPKPQYEIYAIRYATVPAFAVSGLVEGADASRKIDIAMMVWLIRGDGRNILFDSGFYRDQFMKQWHPTDYVKPSESVAKLGLKPEDITTPTAWTSSPRRKSGCKRTSWNITPAKPGNRGAPTAASIPTTSWRR
jgi:hypothetical protein